mmetsp:Transcript_3142/g.7211  ORF Transcript_3142/g.7211 Transcript_3142/m.7211 type:complete len:567 (+) Transcript_3142:89-1789(+)
MAGRTTERMSSFKKGIDAKDGRRRRDDTRIQIRKNKREEGLMKRRAMGSAAVGVNGGTVNTNPDGFSNASSLSGGSSATTKVYSVQDIPQLYNGISTYSHVNTPVVLESVRAFRRLLSKEDNPPCEDVIQCGALPHFVRLLAQQESVEIQFESAWALTNIASSKSEHTSAVVGSNAIPLLVSLLQSGDPNVREQCAWCLGNIAGDSPELRDTVLSGGAMEGILLNISTPASASLLSNMVWSLSNLCRGKPQPQLHVVSPALPHLSSLLRNDMTPKEVVVDVAWSLSYLSDGDDQRIQACQDAHVTGRLVEFLASNQPNLLTPCLRTLGNFVSGGQDQTQAVVDASVLDHVCPLLAYPRKNIRKETCWMLSNIAAGTHYQVDCLVSRTDVMSAVISALSGDQWDVRKEAAWVLSNICTGGTTKHIEKLVEMGAIDALCGVMGVQDTKIVTVALEAIESILKAGEALSRLNGYVSLIDEVHGIEKIEQLQEHENDEIYEKAIGIIEKYFGCEDEQEDENLVPEISGDTFSFGIPSGAKVADDESSDHKGLAPFNFAAAGDEMQFNFGS